MAKSEFTPEFREMVVFKNITGEASSCELAKAYGINSQPVKTDDKN